MDKCRGGSSTPSYREVVVNKSKESPDSNRGNTMEGGKMGKRKQKVTRRRMAQRTKRKMTKNREQKTGNNRDCASPKLKSFLE